MKYVDFKSSTQHRIGYMNATHIHEISTIAHSAFLILSIISAHANGILDDTLLQSTVPCLIDGVLHNQNVDATNDKLYGAFKIDFDSNAYGYYHGIDLYPAEAMLALLTFYEFLSTKYKQIVTSQAEEDDIFTSKYIRTKQSEIIHSISIAFKFYRKYYTDRNNRSDYIIFFSNWQSQLFGLLFQIMNEDDIKQLDVLDVYNMGMFVLRLQHDVLSSVTFHRHFNANNQSMYDRLATVEVACGLESLCDGLRIAYHLDDKTMAGKIHQGIRHAVTFLNSVQDHTKNGGFSHSVLSTEQRIDVTGHVANAYIKLMEITQETKK